MNTSLCATGGGTWVGAHRYAWWKALLACLLPGRVAYISCCRSLS